jgi:hypothetical protein
MRWNLILGWLRMATNHRWSGVAVAIIDNVDFSKGQLYAHPFIARQ